jgi:hypothetical protein
LVETQPDGQNLRASAYEHFAEGFSLLAAAERASVVVAPPVAATDPDRLVPKVDAARALGVSVATLDRAVAAGAPFEHVGTRRRFRIDSLRAWFTARGRKPTTPASDRRRVEDDVDVDAVVQRSGLRFAA